MTAPRLRPCVAPGPKQTSADWFLCGAGTVVCTVCCRVFPQSRQACTPIICTSKRCMLQRQRCARCRDGGCLGKQALVAGLRLGHALLARRERGRVNNDLRNRGGGASRGSLQPGSRLCCRAGGAHSWPLGAKADCAGGKDRQLGHPPRPTPPWPRQRSPKTHSSRPRPPRAAPRPAR